MERGRKLCERHGGQCTQAACCPDANFAENLCGPDGAAVCCFSASDCGWRNSELRESRSVFVGLREGGGEGGQREGPERGRSEKWDREGD